MMRHMYKSKIHNAVLTQAELHYTGSITIPQEIMTEADLLPGERVQVLNTNTGDRLETYVIEGPKHSKNFCLNGPAARRGLVGDTLVIISYAFMSEEEARNYDPCLVVLQDNNCL